MSSRNLPTYLTENSGKNSKAPELTLLTAGVSPQASFILTIIPSTPKKMDDLNMLPKFYGSVIPSSIKKN